MADATVQLSAKGRRLLTQLARESHKPMTEVIEAALETYRRQRFVRKANAELARLRRDEKAWKLYRRELAEWDATLSDGLEGID